MLDAGAREAVEKKGKSLLAIGVVDASGTFQERRRRRRCATPPASSSPAG